MDLKFTKTRKGAVCSIHIGKTLTTNMFADGWLEVTDPAIIAKFKNFVRQAKYVSSLEEETNLIKTLHDDIKASCDVSKTFRPYRRERTTSSYASSDIHYDGVISLDGELGEEGAPIEKPELDLGAKRKQVAKNIIKFFSEFTFVPAARFVNTLSHCSNYADCKKYVNDYMSLVDHPDKNEICEKIKSDEFKNIANDLLECASDKHKIAYRQYGDSVRR